MKNFRVAHVGLIFAQVSFFALTAFAEDTRLCDLSKGLERSQGIYRLPGGAQERESWEWEVGTGLVARNVAGVVASALARTASICDSGQAVSRYARVQVQHFLNGEFLFDGDVEALARAADLLGDNQYRDVARRAFEQRYGDATGEEIVGRWMWQRLGPSHRLLVGFDASQAIRAGLAVGANEKAQDIAKAVVRAMNQWEADGSLSDFSDTSRGALLEALVLLRQDSFDSAIEHLAQDLILSQRHDGSWAGYSTQATAFAVRGLSKVSHSDARSAAARGRQWLGSRAHGSQLLQEKIPEVSAEALIALAVAP